VNFNICSSASGHHGAKNGKNTRPPHSEYDLKFLITFNGRYFPQIMMRFFREVCKVKDSRFRANVHAFSHTNVEKTEKYWSKITGIPRCQFQKTYVKASSASLQKRHTLPYGTFTINVCDTSLFLTIMGWIEKIKELTVGDFVRENY